MTLKSTCIMIPAWVSTEKKGFSSKNVFAYRFFIAIANAYTALEAGATHIDTCKAVNLNLVLTILTN